MPCAFRDVIAIEEKKEEKVSVSPFVKVNANLDTSDLSSLLRSLVQEATRPGRWPWSYDGTTKSTSAMQQVCPGPFKRDVILFVANKSVTDIKIRVEGMDAAHYMLFPASSNLPKNVSVPVGQDQLRLYIEPAEIDATGSYHIEIV